MNAHLKFWLLTFSSILALGGCTASGVEGAQQEVSAYGPTEVERWAELVERGERLLAEGKYQEALEALMEADRLTLFEVPNYEATHRIAEARCLLGEREEGLELLENFRCMLAVDRGELPCYVGPETRDAPGARNPAVTDLCFLKMCSELYLSYYENLTEEQLAGIAELGREAERVRRICETMEGDDP